MYEFEEAVTKRPTTNVDEDDSEVDISSGSESQHSSDSLSTENDTHDDTHTTPDIPNCPREIGFPSSPTLTDLAEGKKPGTQNLDSCPKGQVIVGFHGFLKDFTTALVHGRLQAICGFLSLGTIGKQCIVKIYPDTTLPLRGSDGDIEWTRTCPDNEVIIGFGAKTGADIDQLTFYCAPLVVSRDGDSYSFSRGPTAELPKVGGIGGGTLIDFVACPDNSVARTTNIYSDNILTAFGLRCQLPAPI